MKLVMKKLRKTAMVSAIAVLASYATPSTAADNVSDVAHVSASVANALSIVETTPIKFGNLILAAAAATGDGVVTMSSAGVRAVANQDTLAAITLYEGANNAVPGGDDAGAESPGFYAVTGATAAANIYISFAKTGAAAALIDANHPANQVTVTGPGGDFYVDTFVFNQSGSDLYGSYITTSGAGAATVQVGASLKTKAGVTYTDGAYKGTFDIMASY